MSDREAMKLAYGLLWLDGSAAGLKFQVRNLLLSCLSKCEQKEAIDLAKAYRAKRGTQQAQEAAEFLFPDAFEKAGREPVSDKSLPDMSNALVEDEAPEDRFVRDAEIACPACGGSGHKGDITPQSIAELAKPLIWKDRHGFSRTDFQNNMRFEVMDMFGGTWALFISQRGCTDQVEDEFPTIEKAQEAANERYRAELAKSFDHFPVNNKKSG